ncbi:hypothetical protein [Glaciihabitans sp. dw_435]|uniref:hypothetical protein n=1 Tax=Glaciihabitans sp. dw_435 TaxID=2720081 RepID=UPI001BD58051|nr:hypothetical protein [Glaciihabitans sp. dw_435]
MAISKRSRAVAGAALLATFTIGTLSGCGTAPWLAAEGDNTSAPTSSSTATSVPTTTPTQPAPIVSIKNELASGSTMRTVKAGNITMTINYWSTLTMDKWTAAANKPISFSLSGKLAGGSSKQKFYLSKVTLSTAVTGPLGALPAPAASSDSATVTPGYLIKAPYTYSQTFVLPALDSTATSVTLSFAYEILLQTTPTSKEYAKQTGTDSLTIALASTTP